MSTQPPDDYSPDQDQPSALDAIYNRRPLYRRFSQWLGLQVKLMLAFSLLIALTLTSFCYMWLKDGQARLMESLSAEAEQTTLTLAATTHEAIARGEYKTPYNVSQNLVRSGHNVNYVIFFNADGWPMLTGSQRKEFAVEPIPIDRVSEFGVSRLANDAFFGQHLACVLPIINSGVIVGYVKVGVGLGARQHQIDVMTTTAAEVGIALLLLSIPIAWLVVHRIFLPIRQLLRAARKIAAGDFDAAVETRRSDAIGELAKAFNEMIRTIKRQQNALEHANDQLGDANRDLESKVDQRTQQFETANRRLCSEIAEKEDFLRAVSHDLNAPLRNISGMVTMLLMKKKEALGEDVVHRLDRIKKNVEVETDLINELLELSRIKTRRQAMENVELEAMVWDLRGVFENDLKTRHIDLVIDTNLPTLYCEKARIRQVLQNLIDNAIKYMGDGPRREIHVGCNMRLSEAEFYVRDTGVGIDADDVGKVFFVFRRGKNTSAQNVSGKGVGLACVKSIVETYSGKIWVSSEVAKGTTFFFTINGQYIPSTGGGERVIERLEQLSAAA